jgi:hypothetical protein
VRDPEAGRVIQYSYSTRNATFRHSYLVHVGRQETTQYNQVSILNKACVNLQ